MADIIIRKANNVYIQVCADNGVRSGMSEHLSRYTKGYQFHPKYKARIWDGKIRFLNYSNGLIYAGLINQVLAYAKDGGLSVKVEDAVKAMFHHDGDVASYLDTLELSAHGQRIELRDYQRRAIESAIGQKRRLIQSPTSSGKSSIIYGICRYLTDAVFEPQEKILIVVPTIGLVTQLKSDFIDYSALNEWDAYNNISLSTEKARTKIEQIHITTWQSIFKKPEEWFGQFRALIVDEAHQAKAASLVSIGKKCDAEFRIGLSGSIDSEDETTELTITGLFGFKLVTTTTKQLMDEGTVAKAKVNCVEVSYGDGPIPEKDYQHEIDWIVKQTERNQTILNLANDLKGNVLILFSLVEKHGKVLRDMAAEQEGKELFFVYGGVASDERETIRKTAETHEGCIILASYQTFSTGINIRNIRHIIFASPTKSFTRVIQSIGRGLRTSATKTECDIWDFFDDIYERNGVKNYTHQHFVERAKIYIREGFEYSINKLHLNNIL